MDKETQEMWSDFYREVGQMKAAHDKKINRKWAILGFVFISTLLLQVGVVFLG